MHGVFQLFTHRSLHANGVDELLVFLGSNTEEVRTASASVTIL